MLSRNNTTPFDDSYVTNSRPSIGRIVRLMSTMTVTFDGHDNPTLRNEVSTCTKDAPALSDNEAVCDHRAHELINRPR